MSQRWSPGRKGLPFNWNSSIPVNSIVLPLVGSPSVEAVHLAGAAWSGDDEPQWVQNAGVGVIFALARARMVINPADRPIEPAFSFGFYIPQR